VATTINGSTNPSSPVETGVETGEPDPNAGEQNTPSASPPVVTPAAADPIDTSQLRAQYAQTLGKFLQRHKRYPRNARSRRHEGTVFITFVVNSQGEVSNPRIHESSGSTFLDEAALTMIQRAGTLPPIPAGLAEASNTIQVTVPIQFQLP